VTEFSNSENRDEAPGGRFRSYLPALKLIGIGWYFAAAVLIGIGGGYLLDQLAGTSPIFTLIGVLLALISAFYGAYKMIADVIRQSSPTSGKPRV
jgi:F0F1-type ATP synthase assembly protein I